MDWEQLIKNPPKQAQYTSATAFKEAIEHVVAENDLDLSGVVQNGSGTRLIVPYFSKVDLKTVLDVAKACQLEDSRVFADGQKAEFFWQAPDHKTYQATFIDKIHLSY